MAMIWQNRLRQKRCARGKLVGVEEEIFWKSYKLKLWHRFQNHNFITYKEGRLTSNLGLQNVGSLTFCIVIVKKIVYKKKLFTEHELEKCCEAKNMHKGHIIGRRKNFNQKKNKIEGVAFISKKYLKSHFRDPKKRYFQFRILRSVSLCSLYLLQTVF